MWNQLVLFYHRMGSPKLFYPISVSLIPWLVTWTLILFMVGTYLSLVYAPADYQQGEGYRIMFVHVPAAWMSLFIYMVMAVAAVIGFVWRIKTAFILCICAAPIGAGFTLLALATGSIWGKPMWGTWWEWDARLTSELILLFLYIGVVALYGAFENAKSGEKAAAILAIVGAVNIPVIHYSVVWWNSLHQTSSVLRPDGPAMPMTMLLPLLIMALAFKAFFGWILILRMQNHILENNQYAQWVSDLLVERS